MTDLQSLYHIDVIHDISHNFYGKRMAACSSDQCVKVIYTVDRVNEFTYFVISHN